MKCECAVQLNKLLEPKGERLDLAMNVKGQLFYIVKITKLFGRGKTTLMLAKFCPFCGTKQEEPK